MKSRILLASTLGLLAWVGSASATFISFGGGGSTGDGSVSASAQFTTDASGNLTIVLNNLQSGQNSQGQSVSGILFTFGGTAPGTLSFVSQTGVLVNIATGGAETFPGGLPTRWDLESGPGATALTGTQPEDMIVGPSPVAGTGGFDNFNPYINLTGTFVVHGTTLNASTTITAATFQFGTGPDATKPGTECTSSTQANCGGTPSSGINPQCTDGTCAVPEPNSAALALLGLGLVSGTLLRRKYVSGRRA